MNLVVQLFDQVQTRLHHQPPKTFPFYSMNRVLVMPNHVDIDSGAYRLYSCLTWGWLGL